MHVPYFLLFLCFRKATQEIFSELDETKAKVPIFPDTRRSPKQRRRGARGQPHHRVARPSPWPRQQLVGPPGPPPDIALPPIYILLGEKTLRPWSIFHETYCKPPPSSMRDWDSLEALAGTLPETGITTRGLLHHHACLRSDAWVVYYGDPAYHYMCSMQVVDITPMKHRLTSITSLRVVQQKHRRSKVWL
jgi:hypothetical protein